MSLDINPIKMLNLSLISIRWVLNWGVSSLVWRGIYLWCGFFGRCCIVVDERVSQGTAPCAASSSTSNLNRQWFKERLKFAVRIGLCTRSARISKLNPIKPVFFFPFRFEKYYFCGWYLMEESVSVASSGRMVTSVMRTLLRLDRRADGDLVITSTEIDKIADLVDVTEM